MIVIDDRLRRNPFPFPSLANPALLSNQRRNDEERELWVRNDEPLYREWRASRLPIRRFIRENRSMIDDVIESRLGRRRERSAEPRMI